MEIYIYANLIIKKHFIVFYSLMPFIYLKYNGHLCLSSSEKQSDIYLHGSKYYSEYNNIFPLSKCGINSCVANSTRNGDATTNRDKGSRQMKASQHYIL